LSATISADNPCGTNWYAYRSDIFGPNTSPGPWALEPIGTRLIASTPPAMATSYWPAMIA
jgi:hypothetical protein